MQRSVQTTSVIPRLVVQEVTRNLITPGQVQSFHRLLAFSNFAFVVDEPIPRNLVEPTQTTVSTLRILSRRRVNRLEAS